MATTTDSDTGPQSSISISHSTLDGKPVVRTVRNLAAIVAAAGSAVASIAFFLPWEYVAQQQSIDITAPASASGHYISGWQWASQLFGAKGASATDALSLFFLIAMPLIMAVIVLIVAGSDLSQRPIPIMWSVALAAGILGVIALFFENLYNFALAYETNSSSVLHIGFGIMIAFLGYLAILAGCISALMQRSPAPTS